MWVEADMNLPSGESLVRQIVFGQRYFEEKFGRRCTEVWIPDVFGYPAGLPQVFVAGGHEPFVTQKLSWNKQNRFPHSTFWWEGLDGFRVLTHFPPVDTYNAEITPQEFGFSITNFRDHGWSTDSPDAVRPRRRRRRPDPRDAQRARRLGPHRLAATLEVDTADAMFTRIEHDIERGASAPVWRGELYFETHRGTLTSQLKTKLGNRRCERLLVEAEFWSAALGRPADVDALWTQVLTQQFHDILPGSSIAWAHQDAEAVFAEVEAELQGRIGELIGEATGGAACVANRSDTEVDEVVLVGDSVAVEWRCTGAITRSSSPMVGLHCACRRPRSASVRWHRCRRRSGRDVGHVDDEPAPRGAVGCVRQPDVDHRSATSPRTHPDRAARCGPRTRAGPSGRVRRVGSRVVDAAPARQPSTAATASR